MPRPVKPPWCPRSPPASLAKAAGPPVSAPIAASLPLPARAASPPPAAASHSCFAAAASIHCPGRPLCSTWPFRPFWAPAPPPPRGAAGKSGGRRPCRKGRPGGAGAGEGATGGGGGGWLQRLLHPRPFPWRLGAAEVCGGGALVCDGGRRRQRQPKRDHPGRVAAARAAGRAETHVGAKNNVSRPPRLLAGRGGAQRELKILGLPGELLLLLRGHPCGPPAPPLCRKRWPGTHQAHLHYQPWPRPPRRASRLTLGCCLLIPTGWLSRSHWPLPCNPLAR